MNSLIKVNQLSTILNVLQPCSYAYKDQRHQQLNLVTGISDNMNNANKRIELQEVSDFFVDAFWTGKVGGGAKTLSKIQRQQLEQSQNAEFTKRYGNSRRISEMLLVRNTNSKSTAVRHTCNDCFGPNHCH